MARLLKEQLSSVLPIEDQNFGKFNLGYYSTRMDPNMKDSPRENMEDNLYECKKYAKEFGESSPNLLMYGSTGLGKTFLSTCNRGRGFRTRLLGRLRHCHQHHRRLQNHQIRHG